MTVEWLVRADFALTAACLAVTVVVVVASWVRR